MWPRLTVLFIICSGSNSQIQTSGLKTVSQNDSQTFDDWVIDHIRFFDTGNFNYNWTEMIETQSEKSFTVALSVFYKAWYPKLKFGATFLKALESHFRADGEIWKYDFK